MSAETIAYKKLPGTGYRKTVSPAFQILLFFVVGFFVLLLRGRKVQLWLGGDHLLVVDSNGYTEEYKRYYFRDIQGIVVRPTVSGKMINVLLALPLALLLWGALAADQTGDAAVFMVFAAFFLVLLIVNIVRGGTCEAELFTAVQSEPLVTLHRMKVARKVVAQLQPLVASAQGELKPEEVQAAQAGLEKPHLSSPMAEAGLPVPEVNYRGKVHMILAWVALADVLGTAGTILAGAELTRVYSLIHIAAVAVLAIIAMNKQRGTNLPVGLKRLPVFLLTSLVTVFLLSFCWGIYMAFTRPEMMEQVQEQPLGTTWQLVMTVLSTGLNAAGGLYGIRAFKRYQQSLEPIPQVPGALPPESPQL